ncbi:MAG TPA: alpha/beta hydrolase [Solirubrobacteraceae bacterium]|nr:alpha/beta hydrolase [Solirubrobacteraceae bacterium]
MPDARTLGITTGDDVTLSGEQTGEGPPVVLLHGLTATRRYVVMGSGALARTGHRVIAYDARGHGRSSPAGDPCAYGYERLAADLGELLDAAEAPRAVLVGASMGAHTIARFALDHPERVMALALITPAFDPGVTESLDRLAHWDALARGLRERGVEGFLAAYDLDAVPARWRGMVALVIRQRLSAHEHPEAVADALQAVPRSRPFEDLAQLAAIRAQAVVIASRDEADPEHPLAVGECWARAIPGARLLVERPGEAPLAWQGAQLSRVIAELAKAAA